MTPDKIATLITENIDDNMGLVNKQEMTDSAKDIDKVLIELQTLPKAQKARNYFNKDFSSLDTLGTLAQLFDSLPDSAEQKPHIERYLKENGLRRNMALQIGMPYSSLRGDLSGEGHIATMTTNDFRTAKITRIHSNSWTKDDFEIIQAVYDLG